MQKRESDHNAHELHDLELSTPRISDFRRASFHKSEGRNRKERMSFGACFILTRRWHFVKYFWERHPHTPQELQFSLSRKILQEPLR
jgi:hypothetical protein